MARYEHLPIYKVSMDLAVLIENGARNMSRYNKYAIGTELRIRSLKGLSLVVRANSIYDSKIPVLEELRVVLEELRQLLFLAKETKALASFQFYKECMSKVENLSKQNEGWLKSQRKSK
jgi:hypothetical protein